MEPQLKHEIYVYVYVIKTFNSIFLSYYCVVSITYHIMPSTDFSFFQEELSSFICVCCDCVCVCWSCAYIYVITMCIQWLSMAEKILRASINRIIYCCDLSWECWESNPSSEQPVFWTTEHQLSLEVWIFFLTWSWWH